MGQHRMFSKAIVRADRFVDMPFSAQALYFQLGMEADDDGFVESPKAIARMIGARNEDIATLAHEGFVILFETGVIVITDWLTNNRIRQDRKRETIHLEELSSVEVVNGRYVLLPSPAVLANAGQLTTTCQPNDNQLPTNCQPFDNQVTTNCQPTANQMPAQDKVRQDKVSKDKTPQPSKEAKSASLEGVPPAKERAVIFNPPTYDEVRAFVTENNLVVDPERFVDYYASIGWRVGHKPMKSWKATVKNWDRKDREERGSAPACQQMRLEEYTDFSGYETLDEYMARTTAGTEATNGDVQPA